MVTIRNFLWVVGVDYSCAASSRVVEIGVMVGEPQAEQAAAAGSERRVVCDGTPQSAVVVVAGVDGAAEPIKRGTTVQVRIALVDADGAVVVGQAKLVELA